MDGVDAGPVTSAVVAFAWCVGLAGATDQPIRRYPGQSFLGNDLPIGGAFGNDETSGVGRSITPTFS